MRRKSMSGPVKCLVYIIALGVVSFVTGRLLPKRWFKSDCFPFRCNEKEKKLYKALRVKDWQNKVPDMSRVFTKLMPAKKLNAGTLADIPRMLEETCVAEFIHVVLSAWSCVPLAVAGLRRRSRDACVYPSRQRALHHHSAL